MAKIKPFYFSQCRSTIFVEKVLDRNEQMTAQGQKIVVTEISCNNGHFKARCPDGEIIEGLGDINFNEECNGGDIDGIVGTSSKHAGENVLISFIDEQGTCKFT